MNINIFSGLCTEKKTGIKRHYWKSKSLFTFLTANGAWQPPLQSAPNENACSSAKPLIVSKNDKISRKAIGDQWLLVITGEGKVKVAQQEIELKPNTLILIQAGETHEIVNLGDSPLKTLHFYVQEKKESIKCQNGF